MYLLYNGFFDRLRKFYFSKILRSCHLPGGAKVLDYGCGPGDLLLVARALGLAATGIDASPRSVELAKKRGLDVILGDENLFDPKKDQFDVIVMQSVVEHIPDPMAVITKLSELLKPGGQMIVSAPTPGPYFWDDPTHIRPSTPKSLRTLGEIAGLKVERVSYVFSFLLGFTLRSSIIYRLMNLLPLPLGSNLVAFYEKR